MYAGHSNEDGRIQELKIHLQEVSCLAGKFASAFGGEEWGNLIGLMHDIGKYSQEAQNRILQQGPKVDHSTAGAQEIFKRFKLFPAAYCVAGHHSGLPNGGCSADTEMDSTLYGRLKNTSIPSYCAWEKEIKPKKITTLPITPLEKPGFSIAFFIRMLFSCLVDADFLNTEEFMSNGCVKRGMYDKKNCLLKKLETFIEPFASPTSEINTKRSEILQRCMDFGNKKKGLYSLSVPTGGGKTISSMAFALKHLVKHDMRRVIYVIPYTSIIEQNAQVFRNIFGDENVLEHHANVNYEDDTKKLAAENWDIPIVVTTNVQFFESLFASKTSKCRKLHNITNSVIIFDEAQMIPLPYIVPCIQSVRELVNNYGCTAVFCTATQPALNRFIPKNESVTEICGGSTLFEFFKRTDIINAGQLSDEELAKRINQLHQCLCIVNNKSHARNLYELLEGDGIYHLSTLMCPVHRKTVLKTIKTRLNDRKKCLVVATSLIEAGVDVDFPMVYREECGLDSIIQAAGRCNREGKKERAKSLVTVFTPAEKHTTHIPLQVQQAVEISKMVFRKYTDVASEEAIRDYFEKLYDFKRENLDKKNIVERFDKGKNGFSFPFADIDKDFKVIEQNTYTILIPYNDEAQEISERLKLGERNRALLRKAGIYSVSIYQNQFEELFRAGMITRVDEELTILLDMKQYSTEYGLETQVEEGRGLFF